MQRLTNYLKEHRERQFTLTGIVLLVLMLSSHLPNRKVMTLRMAADDFSIPYRQSAILLDGKITEPAWDRAGMIQLGAPQKPIKVYSLHDPYHLYLGFHITDLSMVPGKDCIRIVLNPSLDTRFDGDSLFLRFDILLFSDATRNFVSTWDHSGRIWIQPRAPIIPPIWSETYRDPLLNYWQVEMKINRNQLDSYALNTDKFGLYLQILDFSNDTEYCGYDWPAWGQMNMDDLIEMPHQGRWAWARLSPEPTKWKWLADLVQIID